MKKCFFWGATGQARVLNEFVETNGYRLHWLFDNNKEITGKIGGVKILGGWEAFKKWAKKQKKGDLGFCVAIGGVHYGKARLEIQNKIEGNDFIPLILTHPEAYKSKNAIVGRGSQLLAFSFVGTDTYIGKSVILNTGAQVDHECRIGDGVHVMPGAIITGCVTVERFATIGTGAIILPRLTIGEGAVVGAGAVVTKNVAPYTTVVGNPARLLRNIKHGSD